MDNQKSVLASTTNWAALIGVVGVLLPVFGISLVPGAEGDVVAAVGATATRRLSHLDRSGTIQTRRLVCAHS